LQNSGIHKEPTEGNAAARTGRLAILLILLFVPLAFVPTAIDFQNTNSVYLKQTALLLLSPVVLTLAAFSAGVRRSGRGSARSSPLLVPGVLLAGWIVLGFLRADYPAAAFQEAHRWLCYLCLALGAALLLRDRRSWHKAWAISLVASGIVSLYGVLQFFDYDLFEWGIFPWALPLRRVCASLGNPNFLGGYLVLTVPLTLAALASMKGLRGSGWILLCFCVQALAAGLCFARGGSPYVLELLEMRGWSDSAGLRLVLSALEAAFFIAPVFVYFLLKRWKHERLYPLLVLLGFQCTALALTFSVGSLAATAAGCLVIFVLWTASRLRREGLTRSSRKPLLVLGLIVLIVLVSFYPASRFMLQYRARTVYERLQMYRGTVEMIAERPLAGFGPGMFSVFFPDHRPIQLALYLPPGEWFVDHGHSEYLELTSEFGLVGLALFFWIVLAALWPGFKNALPRSVRRDAFWWLRAALIAGLLATLAQNVISVNLRQVSTAAIFWLSLGWLAGMAAPRAARPIAGGTSFGWFGWSARIGTIVFLAALAVGNLGFVGRDYIGDLLLTQGTAAVNAHRLREGLHYYREALKLIPNRTQGHYFLGALQFEFQDHEGAIESYKKVRELERDFVDVVFNLATTYVKMERYDEALKLYEEAAGKDPKNARLQDYYARTLILAGRVEEARPLRERAIELYREKLQLYPGDVRLYHDLGKNYMFQAIYSPPPVGDAWSQAEEFLRVAIQQEPQTPRYQQSWREFLQLRSRFNAAANRSSRSPRAE